MILGIGIALAIASAAGCASTPCTAAGANNGFTVRYQPAVTATVKTVLLRTCLNGTCQTDSETDVLSPSVITVPTLKGPDPVTVEITVLSPTGEKLGGGQASVTPKQLQPNGPGCGPTSWFADVTASTNGLAATS